jgi:hypothetical protein
MNLAEDRRRKRSNDPLVALHYQLSHARSEGHLETIVVADDAGLVVAGAGPWAACEELAAYAPLLVQSGWHEPAKTARSRVDEIREDVGVQPVDVDGQTVLLCARGGKTQPATMDKTARAVARILRKAA